jgi:hypothetical protein
MTDGRILVLCAWGRGGVSGIRRATADLRAEGGALGGGVAHRPFW